MSHGGGGSGTSTSTSTGQPSCTTVPLGKYARRAFRAATGMKKKPKRKKPAAANNQDEDDDDGPESVSIERVSSFSGTSAARKESVVRVVLKSGVVEVYPGVVMACTVIRKHPPGLCLAHPDVFRNPHGAVVRPLELLFPGQKFLLLPETTVVRLKQKIPESSIGAFLAASDDDEEDEDEHQLQDYSSSSGATGTSSSEEEEEEEEEVGGGGDDDDGGAGFIAAGCSAREFYVANDRWAHCQFNKLQVDRRGLAKAKKIEGNKKRKKRKDRRVAAPAGFRSLATTMMRTWEPSLPSVEEEEEEEACFSPHQYTTPERSS